MLRRSFLALPFLGAACVAASRFDQENSMTADAEKHFWMTKAALLDPRAFHVVDIRGGWEAFDVTVPDGATWHVVNSFAVTFGEPLDVAQDGIDPNTRRSGFVRSLDARRAVMLPAGTRVRSLPGVSQSYLHYCSPAAVWAIDERYDNDPRGLYFQRLLALETMPLREIILEAHGGGALTDDVSVAIPEDVDHGLLVHASVYDGCWALWGGYNLMGEINNSHTVRFAESLMCPFRRAAMCRRPNTLDGSVQDRFVLQKGSYSDAPGSTDPAIAYPVKGTASVLYVSLPESW